MTRKQRMHLTLATAILAPLLSLAIMIWNLSIAWMFIAAAVIATVAEVGCALYNEPPQRFVRWREERHRRRGGGHSEQPLRGHGASVKAPRVSSR